MVDVSEKFIAALKDALEDAPRGFQARIAQQAGIGTSMLTDIKKGRSTGSDETRRAIAAALGYSARQYEYFLDRGAAIIAGKPIPEEESTALGEDEMRARGFFPVPFSDNMKLAAGGGRDYPN